MRTNMAISMNERLAMLQAAANSWLELRRVLDTISDSALRKPDTVGVWRGQDVLVHLANWDEEAINVLERMAAGEPAHWPLPPGVDGDVWNEERLDPWRSATPAQARAFLTDAHDRLMHIAETMQAVKPRIVLGATQYHYGEHLDDLRALAKASTQ
jgi:hypothetical protein